MLMSKATLWVFKTHQQLTHINENMKKAYQMSRQLIIFSMHIFEKLEQICLEKMLFHFFIHSMYKLKSSRSA